MTLRIEKVVVTGGREFNDLARIEADLRALIPVGLRRLAHGGARGADNRAETAWRRAKPWPRETEVYPVSSAEWKRYGDAVGPMRNAKMLDAEKPDLVLAYPNPPTATTESRGTWDCVVAALKRGIWAAVWLPDLSPGLLAWERAEAAMGQVAARMRAAGLSPPTMTVREGEGRRVIVASAPDHLNARALLEVLHG